MPPFAHLPTPSGFLTGYPAFRGTRNRRPAALQEASSAPSAPESSPAAEKVAEKVKIPSPPEYTNPNFWLYGKFHTYSESHTKKASKKRFPILVVNIAAIVLRVAFGVHKERGESPDLSR